MASEQFLKGIGKPLGNDQITQISTRKMFILGGFMKNLGNEADSQ